MADNPATAQQMAEQIESQADFARELTALRERAGLRIRDVGRLSGIPVSTVGDYFSGRHLPADRQQLIRILEVCGETDPARIAWWEAALQRIRRLPGRRTGTPYRGLARFEQQDARWFFGREDVTEHLVSLAAESLRAAAGAGRPFGGRQVIAAARGPAAAPQRAGRGSPGNRRAGDRARAHGHPGRRPQGPAHRARGEPGRRRRRTPGGHRGPVRGGLHPVPRRGAAARRSSPSCANWPATALVVLALRADFYDQAIRYPGLARALESRQVVLGPMTATRCAAPSSSPPGWPGRTSKTASSGCCSPTWRRRPRTGRAGSARAGRAAAAVARHAGHLGAQPRRHAGDRRLPGERRDQGRAHPDRRARLRQPDAGPAAARQATVPPPGARGRRPAAEPRHRPARRAARTGATRRRSTCSPRSSTSG